MNSVVEKLAAIEQEVAAIQPKMAPLTQRIADLDRKVAGFAQQLTGIAEESAAVKQDIELTQQSLTRIQTLIGESKVESEQLVAGQEENLQRCETMTAVFGAAFQAVSQFFETAQRMGLADQAKAVFLPPAPEPVSIIDASSATASPVTEEPEISEPTMMKMPESDLESVLSESDFDSVISDSPASDTDSEEPSPWSVPDLPDVAALPEMDSVVAEAEVESPNAEPAEEIASQLNVAPLNLAPLKFGESDLPERNELEPMEDTDEQEIEAMLATMMTPVTATAGG